MDLLRLALERGASAEEATRVLTDLIERHGQGGGCGHEDRSFTYHNSYIVADLRGAFVVETAGRHVATERVGEGTRTISNALSIEPFASRHGDRLRSRASGALRRRACTLEAARGARDARDMMGLLRDHGAGRVGPHYAKLNGGMNAPCMHAGGLVVNSQTTASWVSELTAEGSRHFATATAAPCTGLFKPVEVGRPLELGPPPDDRADAASLWWRHERLHRRVLRDPERLLPLFAAERDRIEAAWSEAPPKPEDAFAEGDRLLAEWTARVEAESRGQDERPIFARRFWAARNARAGLAP
jgi:dipeptidase